MKVSSQGAAGQRDWLEHASDTGPIIHIVLQNMRDMHVSSVLQSLCIKKIIVYQCSVSLGVN